LSTQERAKGYPIRPKSTFTSLLEVFKNTKLLKYFEARFQGDLITANISQFTSYWSSSFYGASNRLHPDTKAAYLLRWESVLEAKRRGCRIYDFWGIILDSKQHQGYSETKLSFGGTRMDTYGIFALPLSGWKYEVWDKLLPLRNKIPFIK
jgi:peptidoglycan pentaglycine glycine transferase (the first glycine)